MPSKPIDLDPTHVRSWKELRRYWRHVQGPCARCGKAIDYVSPRYYYLVMADGTRKRRERPWVLDIGHIMGKDIDPRLMWAPIDTQPEHARCNRRAGARYGNRKRARNGHRGAALRTSRDWFKS